MTQTTQPTHTTGLISFPRLLDIDKPSERRPRTISQIVIPARLASTRLPEKLLLRETGKTVLQHTYEAAQTAQLPQGITIAVDSDRLKKKLNPSVAQLS